MESSTEYRGMIDKTPFIAGDGRDPDTLKLAGIEKAAALIAATDDDAVNLSVGLMAKNLNPNLRTVLRLFDGGLSERVEESLRIDKAQSASRIAAPTFAGAALFDDALLCVVAHDRFVVIRAPDGADELQVDVRHLRPSAVSF